MRSFRPLAATAAVGLALILPLAAPSQGVAAEPHVSLRLSWKSETGRSGGDRLTRHASPFIDGRAEAGRTVEVVEGDKVVGTAVADRKGEWRARLSPLPDGKHVLHARVRIDGETVLSKQMRFIVDTVPPKPPTLRLAAGADSGESDRDGRTRYRQLPVEGRADGQTDTVSVRVRGRPVAYAWGVQRSWSARTEKLRPGPVVLTAVASDAAGNESAPSAPLELEIVAQRPTVSLKSLDGDEGAALWVPSYGGGCFGRQGGFSATDFNGDGRGDVILHGTRVRTGTQSRQVMFGAMGADVAAKGKVDVTALPSGRGFEVVAGERTDLLSASVVGAGDIDGDGFGDFAVLAEITTGGSRGYLARVTVVYGSRDGFPASFDLREIGPAEGFHIVGDGDRKSPFGPLLGIGDFNGDGLDDLLFRREKLLQVMFGEAGRTRDVIRLSHMGRADGVAFRLPRETVDLSFAHGDVTGDGLSDILVGRGGTVSLVRGSRHYPAESRLGDVADALLSVPVDDRDPPRIASGFDLDGDGADEIAVLAEHDVFSTWGETGMGFVVFGAAAVEAPPVDLHSELAPDVGFHLTTALDWPPELLAAAGAGDVNGDGFDDLVLSADGGSAGGYLVYGRKLPYQANFDLTALDGSEGFRLEYNGEGRNSQIHCRVGSAGDFNGDGLADLMISGGTGRRITQPGAAAYVVFGRRE
jgi:hypothetical protein